MALADIDLSLEEALFVPTVNTRAGQNLGGWEDIIHAGQRTGVKKHGQWKSERAKDRYVKDTVEYRCSVSNNLGLKLQQMINYISSVNCCMAFILALGLTTLWLTECL